jgi:hypothetical protein
LKTQISLIESISEDVERQNKKLIDRWRCIDERCINEQKKIWCFVNWESKHYNMNYAQMHTWVKTLQQKESHVSVERFSSSLYVLWIEKQNSIEDKIKKMMKHTEKKEIKEQWASTTNMFEKLQQLCEQKMKMKLRNIYMKKMKQMTRHFERSKRSHWCAFRSSSRWDENE